MDGYKSNDGTNEDQDLFSEDEFYLQDLELYL